MVDQPPPPPAPTSPVRKLLGILSHTGFGNTVLLPVDVSYYIVWYQSYRPFSSNFVSPALACKTIKKTKNGQELGPHHLEGWPEIFTAIDVLLQGGQEGLVVSISPVLRLFFSRKKDAARTDSEDFKASFVSRIANREIYIYI